MQRGPPRYRGEREMLRKSESGGTYGGFTTRDGARGYRHGKS